jgi:flagellar basal body-associated protein FliL
MPDDSRDSEREKQGSGQEEDQPRKKFPLWAKILVITLVVIVSSLGAFSITKFILLPKYRAHRAPRQVDANRKMAPIGFVHVIKDLTVNTRESKGRRFVVAEYAIEAKEKSVINEVKSREPQLRDEFIKYLRNRTVDQILDAGFQEDSKSDLMTIVNKRLNSGKIDSLYYTKLIVQ